MGTIWSRVDMIAAILWDLGGVLCRFRPERRSAAVGRPLPDELLVGLDVGELDGSALVQALEWRAGYDDLARAWATAFEPDPRVMRIVAMLDVRHGMLTNNGAPIADRFAVVLPTVATLIDVPVFSSRLGTTKPAPRAFLDACALLDVPPPEVLLVDDGASNVAAAAKVGLQTHRFTTPEALERLVADVPRRPPGAAVTSDRSGTGERSSMDEQPLVGGIVNAGNVVRVGPHVLRPPTPHTASIHAFLRALHREGFVGAPLPVGIDDDGRERLVFIEGDVPVTPYPTWSQTEEALASIARLLRHMHDAARAFDGRDHRWSDALSDPAGGPIVCHNDLEPSNIVFRDGIAIGFIDFEFAAPGRPVYDLAQMARVCVPMDGEVDRARLGYAPADLPARLRLVADTYGLDREGRAELLAMIDVAFERIEDATRRSVEAGDPNAKALWDRTGGADRFDRRRRWWAAHHEQFIAALR